MLVSVQESDFEQEVIQSSCPVLVSFWAPWCQLCRVVEPILLHWQLTAVPHLKLVRINADENFRLTRDYNLKSIPAILLFNHGELLSQQLLLQGDRIYIQSALESCRQQLSIPLSKS
ncbi:MAG: thioredoxin family protein [Cyanobacteria bacterium P01_F01_bin.42]